jgi:hypothetical protein
VVGARGKVRPHRSGDLGAAGVGVVQERLV